MDRVCNDDDVTDIGYACGLIDTASDGKKLCFSGQDVYCMMDHLDKRTIVDVNVHYRSDDLVLNACVRYNNYRFWICRC